MDTPAGRKQLISRLSMLLIGDRVRKGPFRPFWGHCDSLSGRRILQGYLGIAGGRKCLEGAFPAILEALWRGLCLPLNALGRERELVMPKRGRLEGPPKGPQSRSRRGLSHADAAQCHNAVAVHKRMRSGVSRVACAYHQVSHKRAEGEHTLARLIRASLRRACLALL